MRCLTYPNPLFCKSWSRGGAGRSSGSWSADPQGPGIWFIFWYFGKLTKEGLFGRKIGKLSTWCQFKLNSEHFGAIINLQFFATGVKKKFVSFLSVNWQIRIFFHFEKIIICEINICWSFTYFYGQVNRFHFWSYRSICFNWYTYIISFWKGFKIWFCC